jgi:1-acyl-sn-glycerol-3-phosphate acyltransferase
MSVTGALERARGGAAYLAIKAGVPILPCALTGTENKHVYGEWKLLHRPRLTLTIGPAFRLPDLPLEGTGRRQSLEQASTIIMTHLAGMLPLAYRGVYAEAVQPSASPQEETGIPALAETDA